MTSEKQLCLIWIDRRVPIAAGQERGQWPSGANVEPSTYGLRTVAPIKQR